MTDAAPALDPITAEVIRSAVETVCFEMATFVSRTATTPILNQSNERNATVLDWQGRLAALSVGIPQFMLSATLPVRFAIDFFGDELTPGDVIVANDPYHGGGHLPDFNVFAPVFDSRGDLLLIASIQCHHGDTGGAMAGGYNVFAKDIWSEGVRYPLLKIVDGGRERRDVVLTMRANNRLEGFIGDLRAQVGAAQLGVRRLTEIIETHGEDTVRAAVDWTIADAHERFSAEIAQWPDGTYEADVYVDCDPLGNADIHVHVAITVDDDHLVVDFAGSDERPELNAWSTFGNTRGYTIAQLASLVDPTIPKNEGFFDCIDLRIPEGTCVNPVAGKPVSAGTHHPGVEVGDVIAVAMAQILPDRCAPQTYKYGAPRQMWGDVDPRTGRPFFDHGGETNAGWVNAVRGVDGWGTLVASNGNLIKASAELNEVLFPHLLHGRNYRTDSGGAGQWRGGCGSHFVKEVRTPTYVNQYVVNQRHLHPGIAGGASGTPDRCTLHAGTDHEVVVDPTVAGELLQTGERLQYDFGGGGGWGDPLLRDPQAVLDDVWDEYVSVEGASRDYGVVITGSLTDMTLAVDAAATSAAARRADGPVTGYRLGIDVGGTFTDCVLLDPDGALLLEKTPTTPADQSEGVLDGINRLAAASGFGDAAALLARTDSIVHGTTTGDNTMIEMSGANTGLLVTEGFRDEIEFRRCYKEDIWDPALPAPEPIARRRVRLEIPERLTAEGDVVVPLDERVVRAAVQRLRAFGVTSIAVVYLHSYVNPAHELRTHELVLEEYPEVELVSLSHQVYPKPPEFERTSTTLVNAYVGPRIVGYLAKLEGRLRGNGFDRELLIATSSGGVATPVAIGSRAVATIGSGPTGGVVAAARVASSIGSGDVVSVDMGGTSYDVCLIRGGSPELAAEWNWRHRYCVALPMVDIHSIGAGGGSIARVAGGMLHVGPESAGSQPGPACYGRGGTEPTVTDADLVLGRLDPEGFWGGRLRLDVDAARAALTPAGKALDLEVEETAAAIVTIVDAHMTDAIRRVCSLAGADPRRLDLVAFGGMGGLHATAHAAALGMARVIVPDGAPGFSALGLLTADHVVDAARAQVQPWQALDLERYNALADDLERSARAELTAAGMPEDRIELTWFCNLVYPGQTFDVPIPFPRAEGHALTAVDVAACVEEFHRRNEAARLIEARAQEPTVRGLRLVAIGRVEQPARTERPEGNLPQPLAHRRVHLGGSWHDDVPVYDGDAIPPGPTIQGPAVLARRFTTILLRPGDRARVRPSGDTVVDVG